MVVSQERRDSKTFWEIRASWCAHSKVGNKVPANRFLEEEALLAGCGDMDCIQVQGDCVCLNCCLQLERVDVAEIRMAAEEAFLDGAIFVGA